LHERICREASSCLAPGKLGEELSSVMGDLLYASLAKSTWQKYSSGWSALASFESELGSKVSWPMSVQEVRSFVVWCFFRRKLKPGSVKSYLSSIACLHRLKGLSPPPSDDNVVSSLMTGAQNLLMAAGEDWPNKRRAMTMPLLKHLGHNLASSGWSPATVQTIWSACLVSFFGSTRMGEILAENSSQFDPSSTLTWSCIKFRSDGSILLFIRLPKTRTKEGEFVDLFPFPESNCCPVKALEEQLSSQKRLGFGRQNDPVFTLPNGSFLTMEKLNKSLKELLSDIVDFEKDEISCHSFRAAVPSALSRFPDLATSDDIQGWGRWSSSCYRTYTRLKIDQKRKIFEKITWALS